MSLMDDIYGAATGAARAPQPTQTDGTTLPGLAGGDPAQAAAVMGTMMELLQQKGGLGGVLDAFRNSGMAAHADSWVAGGPNLPVSGDQVEQALGSPIIDLIASRLGLSPDQAKATLSQLVPAITSRMAAHERATGEAPQDLGKALEMFKGLLG
jgi:uncharacterized protein YidB (DUF937 family)